MNTQPQDNMGGNVQGNAGQEDYVDKGRHFQPYFRAGGNAHRILRDVSSTVSQILWRMMLTR